MTGKDIKTDWCDVYRQMPDLILDLVASLRCYGCDSVREFCILRDSEHRPSPGNRFDFCETEHDDLLDKLDLLTAPGWIVPVASNAEPIYRMTDEFAEHLLDSWPERRWPERNC